MSERNNHKNTMGGTNVVLDLVQIDRSRSNSTRSPCFQPPLVKLLVMNRHNICNAVPFFCSWNDGESTIRGRPGDIIVYESKAVGV